MKRTSDYYDEFSFSYEHKRNQGYHVLIDELEVEALRPVAEGERVLEAGCGTGLIMERLRQEGANLFGADLSRGMLRLASCRGFRVVQADICSLPFKDESFDIVYSFKVLAHVEDVEKALGEMVRVTRKGGRLFPEFYNRSSFRMLARLLKGPRRISDGTTDREVYTRYDWWKDILSRVPPSCRLEGVVGVRIWTLFPFLIRPPLIGALLALLERASARGPLKRFAGFVILVLRRLS